MKYDGSSSSSSEMYYSLVSIETANKATQTYAYIVRLEARGPGVGAMLARRRRYAGHADLQNRLRDLEWLGHEDACVSPEQLVENALEGGATRRARIAEDLVVINVPEHVASGRAEAVAVTLIPSAETLTGSLGRRRVVREADGGRLVVWAVGVGPLARGRQRDELRALHDDGSRRSMLVQATPMGVEKGEGDRPGDDVR